MTQALTPSSAQRVWTAADLFERFGPIPLDRIRTDPPPGLATLNDAIAFNESKRGLCEFVDGVLVEKTVGAYESYLAMEIAFVIRQFLVEHNLGVVLVTDGSYRFVSGRMRMPDVSFISWQRMGDYDLRSQAVVPFAPDLAVEVLSPSNTERELEDQLEDYFTDQVHLVWVVDPQRREVSVYVSQTQPTVLGESDRLEGGDVLPGFALSLENLFAKPQSESAE